MTALPGRVGPVLAGGTQSARVQPALGARTPYQWPPASNRLADGVGSGAAIAGVVVAAPVAHAGARSPTISDDWYERIHIDPARIDLGNLVSDQQHAVVVWNAWRYQAQTVTSVQSPPGAGIDAVGEDALPLVFAPLQQRAWTVSISAVGSSVIAAVLNWVFVGLEPVRLTITGNRLVAWMIPPDWSDNLTETLTWLTDLQQAVDGSQDRQPCLPAPRRTWEFPILVQEQERQVVEAALYDWSARTWVLPVWTDVSRLAAPLAAGASAVPIDTSGLDYLPGNLAVLWASPTRYELVELASVASNALNLARPTTIAWPRGTQVLPGRTATLTEMPALRRKTDRSMGAQLRFEAMEDCDWPAIAPTATYLGIPVLEQLSHEPQDLAAAYGRQITRVDNDLGAPWLDDPSGLAWRTQSYNWLVQGRSERAALRSLLYWLQGRASALWLPSGNADITLAVAAGVGTTVLTVRWGGISRFLRQQPGRRHLRIALWGGAVLYRRVTASTELDADTEQLALDTALDRTITPAQVDRISWLMLATLAGDRVEIGHVHESEGIAGVGATFAGVPREEP